MKIGRHEICFLKPETGDAQLAGFGGISTFEIMAPIVSL